MRIIEVVGGINVSLSILEYDLYVRVKKYCENAKTNKIPLNKFNDRNYQTAMKLVDYSILDRVKGGFILREEQL